MANLKTAITFGLVNIPVRLNSVIKNNDTSFNYLHKQCLNRVSYIKYCPTCKKDVKNKDLIKGYEYTDDKYVTFDDQDFEKLKADEDKTIDIISFVKMNEIDPIYYEKSYCLKTEGKSSKAFSLFKAALKKCGKVAIAKTVLGNKSYYVVLRFGENNIIMTTLFYEEEINLNNENLGEKFTEKEMNLALKLIDSMTDKFKPSEYKDDYQDKIKDAIEKKIDGKEIKQSRGKKKTSVANLMDALEKSLKDRK